MDVTFCFQDRDDGSFPTPQSSQQFEKRGWAQRAVQVNVQLFVDGVYNLCCGQRQIRGRSTKVMRSSQGVHTARVGISKEEHYGFRGTVCLPPRKKRLTGVRTHLRLRKIASPFSSVGYQHLIEHKGSGSGGSGSDGKSRNKISMMNH
jgi:hypothetical protein